MSLLADQSTSALITHPQKQNVHTPASGLQRLQKAEADQESILGCLLPSALLGLLAATGCFLGGMTQVDPEVDRLVVHSSEELGYTNGQGKERPRFLEESPVPF